MSLMDVSLDSRALLTDTPNFLLSVVGMSVHVSSSATCSLREQQMNLKSMMVSSDVLAVLTGSLGNRPFCVGHIFLPNGILCEGPTYAIFPPAVLKNLCVLANNFTLLMCFKRE